MHPTGNSDPNPNTQRACSGWLIALGPSLGSLVYATTSGAGLQTAAAVTAGVTAWCAAWWITDAVPMGATSLLPFALFPLLDVLTPKALASAYGHPIVLLLLGGFILSKAMEETGTHQRVAHSLLRSMGAATPARMVFAFMLVSALLSMWISNSATTVMLLPVALAALGVSSAATADVVPKHAAPVLLGIAYGSSLGGLATPIGTPPNAILIAALNETTGRDLSFLQWMAIGLPCTLLMFPLTFWVLTRGLRRTSSASPSTSHVAPRWLPRERRMLAVLMLAALGWTTRTAPFGGWSELWDTNADDSTVALLAGLLVFTVPNGEGRPLLAWQHARGLPWHLLLLFAAGLAIAQGFEQSGLSMAIGQGLAGFADWHPFVLIWTLCLAVTLLTEVTSNTATATLLMPVLAAAALAVGLDPLLLMAPAALSASCAFMLPIATPPNAVVFGSGVLTIQTMVRHGLVLNLLGTLVITAVSLSQR